MSDHLVPSGFRAGNDPLHEPPLTGGQPREMVGQRRGLTAVIGHVSGVDRQDPIAVGAGFRNKYLGTDQVSVAFFGDGATSQGDVHEGFVWAAVYDAPVVFFCQNNQWAISEPIERQTRIPLYQRALGFGFPGIRVDGNDVLAVLELRIGVETEAAGLAAQRRSEANLRAYFAGPPQSGLAGLGRTLISGPSPKWSRIPTAAVTSTWARATCRSAAMCF